MSIPNSRLFEAKLKSIQVPKTSSEDTSTLEQKSQTEFFNYFVTISMNKKVAKRKLQKRASNLNGPLSFPCSTILSIFKLRSYLNS